MVKLVVGNLVAGMGLDVPVPLGILLGPAAGQPQRLVQRQSGVGLLQAPGDGLQVGVMAQLQRAGAQRADIVHPLHQTLGGVLGLCCRQAETFQIHQAPHALGAHAGILRDDVAAHAVPHQIDGRVAGEMVQQIVQIQQIVGKDEMIGLRGRGVAEAAPVGRDDVALLLQRIHQELVGVRYVHPAVTQHQQGLAFTRRAPFQHMVLQVADRQHA